MYCLCLKIKGNGKRIEKGFEESGASSASCGQMFPPNPGFGCPGMVVCWADGTLPVFSQWGLSARCGTGWGSSDEPFRLGGDPGATIRVEASSSHSTERMGLGDGAGPLSHNSHPQPFAPPSHGERGVKERDSGAGFFFWHVRYLFAFFYFKGEKGDVHTDCGLVSGKTQGKALNIFFFLSISTKIFFQILYMGQKWMAQCTWKKGEPIHTTWQLSPVLLEEERRPSELLDCAFSHSACKDCLVNIYAGKPQMKMDVLSPSLWAQGNTSHH